jgi:hypothetical protein
MAESVTISSAPPDFKSMQYDFLREEGLKHIQNLAGKIWTDYNLSDPGISILELLSYIITDLGYRTSYPIQDLLAKNPNNNNQFDFKNFHTARQILPVSAVTLKDYRKLLIDLELYDTTYNSLCRHVGVKNAWIDIAPASERAFYIQEATNNLDYEPEVATNPKLVNPKILYNVLLEFGECNLYGDLNETTLERIITLSACASPNQMPAGFNGMKINVKVEFPRWDDEGINCRKH